MLPAGGVAEQSLPVFLGHGFIEKMIYLALRELLI